MNVDQAKMFSFSKDVIAIIAVCFAVFFFLDDRHAHEDDMVQANVDMQQRVLMSDSTRYAEVNKHYTDRLKDGETLTKAELSRLELVQKQQERINKTLTGK